MIKRILNIFLAFSLCYGGVSLSAKAEGSDIHIFFNDTEIAFTYKPTLSGDTIMCELEPVMDALHIVYNYNGVTNTISCVKENKYSLDAVIGEDVCEADLCVVDLDAPFAREGNKTIMPLDSVCYIYNILIDRSDLSRVVLSERPREEEYDYNAAMTEATDNIGNTWMMYEEEGDFFKAAVHQKDDNDTVWWTEEETPVADPKVGVETATRIEVKNLPSTFYAYQICDTPDKAVPADSLVLISFWAKSVYADNDSGYAKANVVWEEKKYWNKTIQEEFVFTDEWEKYYCYAPIPVENPANGFQLGFRFCYFKQIFEIADFQMMIVPNGATMELPSRPADYQGVEDDAIWRKEALKRIEKYRKNNMVINVVDEEGNPIKNARVEADMTRFEMLWGAQDWGVSFIPRFNTYNKMAPNTNNLWEMLLSHGFNTIVLGNENKPNEYNPNYIANFINWCIDNDVEYRAHCFGWDSGGFTMQLSKYRDDPIVRGYHHESVIRSRQEEAMNLLATYTIATNKYPVHIDVYNEVASHYERALDPEYATGLDELVRYFKMVRKINPYSKLVLNEVGIGGIAPGSGVTDLFPDLAKALRAMGCPFDALGMQGHIASATYPEYWYENAERISPYTDCIVVTEFDTTEKRPDYLYKYVRDTLIACYSHPKIKCFMIWTPQYVSNSSNRLEVLFTKGTEGRYHDPLPGWNAWCDLVMGEWWTDMDGMTDQNGEIMFRAHRGRHKIRITVGELSGEIEMTLTDVDENNKVMAVASENGITLTSPVQYIKGETQKYLNPDDFGKKTEFYELPQIEYAIGQKGSVLSCVDSRGANASVAVDFDETTIWEGTSEDDGVVVELDKVHELKQLEISWDNGFIKRFKHRIEVSEDGENWITVIAGATNSAQTQFTDLTGYQGKYIRVSGAGTKPIIKDLHVYVY